MNTAPVERRLRDGTVIEIRPIQPEDRQALREGFERLSPESRYRRFFGPMPELSERELDYLTQIDHHDHEALLAIATGTGEGLGVARFVRTGPGVAEPAIAVIDDWQGRGVGTQLLDALVVRAREERIDRFEAPVLASNTEAINVLQKLGQTTRRRSGRELELAIELPETTEPGRSWPQLLRQFAVGALEPARAVVERVRPRRPGTPEDERANVIVVGTDGTELASEAVRTAAELARGSGARLELVAAHPFMAGSRDELESAVQATVAALRDTGLLAGAHVRRGDPALVLTDLASQLQARLIVVGAGERSKNARRLLGSVADFVAERSPCNVLIVRAREG